MAELTPALSFDLISIRRQLAESRLDEFIRACEHQFLQVLFDVASELAWRPKTRVVFISGPTSSGKTTTTNRLAGALRLRGQQSVVLSLDDYYVPQQAVRIIDGRKDFESPETLDLDGIQRAIQQLLDGETVQLPTFDFKTRDRIYEPHKKLALPPDGMLLVEGLHGLSQKVAGKLDREQWYGIMLRPWAEVTEHRQPLLSPRDLRMLRRTSRDVSHRNTPALATIDYWPMLDQTEASFFPEYIERADIFINTALKYEPCVIAPLACQALEEAMMRYNNQTLPPTPYTETGEYADIDRAVAEVERLIESCSRVPVLSAQMVPDISILNEFLH